MLNIPRRIVPILSALMLLMHSSSGQVTASALVRHAPVVNGTVEGSVQQMLGENVALHGGSVITEELKAPGTPTVTLNGKPNFGGTIVGSGSASPSNYGVTLNGNARLGHLRTRTDAVALTPVAAPSDPAGSRVVAVNQRGQNVGDWATLKNLTLNGNVGQYAVPPGAYGDFTASGGSGFTLGVAGATQPAVYQFQRLTLNGQSRLEVVGPVIVKVRHDFLHSGQVGSYSQPGWMELQVSNGGLTLDGGSRFYGYVFAPSGAVTIGGNAELSGGVECDRLTVNGNGLLRLWTRQGGGGNQPPVANDQVVDATEDTPSPITLQAVDPDNGTLSYTITTAPQHGSLSGSAPDLIYTPAANFAGTDSFVFTVSDGAATSNAATVSITIAPVNDAPVAQPQIVTLNEESSVGIELSGTDIEGASLSYAIASGPQHGALSGTAPNITYTPAANFNGDDTFTFTVNDGELGSAPATVLIHVTPVPDEPTAFPLTLEVLEDQVGAITLSGSDADGDALSFSIVLDPSHGVLGGTMPALSYTPEADFFGADLFTYTASDGATVSAPAGVEITVIPVNDAPEAVAQAVETDEDTAVAIALGGEDVDGDALGFTIVDASKHGTLSGTVPNLTYTPNPDYFGADGFTFIVNDGTVDSTPAAVVLTVHPINDVPLALAQTLTTPEDMALDAVLLATDVDGDGLAYEIVAPPADGAVVAGTNGLPQFTYTPAPNFHGSDQLSFRVFDGTAWSEPVLVSILVTEVNDAPVAAAGDDASGTMGFAVALAGTATDDGDPTGSTLAVQWEKVSGPGLVVFADASAAATQAQFGAAGTYVLRLSATDGELSASDEMTVTIAPGNQAPVVDAGENQTLAAPGPVFLQGAASDDGLPINSTIRVAWTKLSGSGSVTFTNPQSLTAGAVFTTPGAYVLRLTASDGVLAASDELTVLVKQPNAAPQVNAGPDATITLDGASALNGSVTDDDLPAGAGLSIAWSKVSGPGAVAFGNASEAATTATFSAPGSYVLQLNASDSDLSGTDTATVVVLPPANRPPTADAGRDQVVKGLVTQLNGVVADDGLPAPSSLGVTWSKVSGPDSVSFSEPHMASTGVAFKAAGTYVLRLTANDTELSASDEILVEVLAANAPPLVNAGADQSIDLAGDAVLRGQVTDDGLPAGSVLAITWEKVSGPGAVSFGSATEASTYAKFTEPGAYVLRLAASDSLASGQDELTVTVAPVNQPPSVEAGPDRLVTLPSRLSSVPPGQVVPVPLTTISTAFNGIIGIDYHAPSGKVLVSVNYPSGNPVNFMLIASDGTKSGFSTVRGLTEELKVATARDSGTGLSIGGFLPGEAFSGTGIPGQIIRLSPDGATARVPWVTLPGETGLMRGSLYVDRTGVFGGDLIVATTTGGVWRINEAGQAIRLASIPTHLEGVMTVPNDSVRYGPWAGKILIGAEAQQRFYTVDAQGQVAYYALGIAPEDIDLIAPGENFFAVDYSGNRLLGAPASAFTSMVGDILVTVEGGPGILYNVRWNGSRFLMFPIATGSQFEHVTFAPSGIVQVPAAPSRPTVQLEGMVSDDGLPAGSTLTSEWEWLSGPAGIAIERASSPATSATLASPGTYVLRLSASDGDKEAEDTMTITVLQPNLPPVVDAGEDQAVDSPIPAVANLLGYVSDDGVSAGSPLSFSWSKIDGPGTVEFPSPNSLATAAMFGAPGIYVLRLTAFDGEHTVSDTLQVRVNAPCDLEAPAGVVAWWPGSISHYFADEAIGHRALTLAGGVAADSGRVSQALRFDGVNDRAFREGDTTLDLAAMPAFTIEFWINPDVVRWAPIVEWHNGTSYGFHIWQDGDARLSGHMSFYNTSGQGDIVNFPNNMFPIGVWTHCAISYDKTTGNFLVYKNGALAGTYSKPTFNGPTSAGYTLYVGWDPGIHGATPFKGRLDEVTFYSRALPIAEVAAIASATGGKCVPHPAPVGNQPPVVTAGLDQATTLDRPANLVGRGTDDGLPTGSTLVFEWSLVSGPGDVTLDAPFSATTNARFSETGTYILRLSATDGAISRSDDVQVQVYPAGNLPPVVDAGPDTATRLNEAAQLSGQATDDGLPTGQAVTFRWSQVSGPGTALFSHPASATTRAVFSRTGIYVLQLAASDSQKVGADRVTVTVGAPVNQPPVVSAGPDRVTEVGGQLVITPEINDDGLPAGGVWAHWVVLSGPGSVSFAGDVLSLAPSFERVGSYTLRLSADDGEFIAHDDVTITVSGGANQPPSVLLAAPGDGTSVQMGQSVIVAATAADPEGALLGVEFHVDGQFLNADDTPPFSVNWEPASPGAHALTAVAVDAAGQRTTTAPANVTATVGPPAVRFTAPLDGAAFSPGSTIALAASASSPAGITRVDFLADGVALGSDSTAPFTTSWSTLTEGPHTLTATAVAGDGQTNSATITVYVQPRPADAPVAEVIAPVNGGSITAPTVVLGTVNSPALKDWTLEHRRLGSECSTWLVLATGTGAVAGGPLGTFDPTLLLNGNYELRLTARDRFGGVSVTTAQVAVEGDMKVGHFTVAFQDLQVPLAGIPLTVVRTYDSREQCPGDFGYGWRLDVESLRLEKNAPLGDGWSTFVTEGTLTTPSTYQLVDDAGHLLSVRMPDGELLRFRPKLVMNRPYSRLASMLDAEGDDVGQAWWPIGYDQPLKLVYRPLGGTKGATLQARGYGARDPWSGGSSSIDGSAHVFVSDPMDGPINLATFDNTAQDAPFVTDANGWELTVKDGRVFLFDAQGRLESMRDPQGNTLAFTRAAGRITAVTHSSGAQVVFHRDGNGFIERITDPRGNELHYAYDGAGHLRAFYDRASDPATAARPTQSFSYRVGSHLLDDLRDAKGVAAVRNYYDHAGRLQRTVDATGKETVFTHDLLGRSETITDRAGKVTRHFYDERGNVTRTEQPDGSVVTTAYHVWSDGRKSELKTTESVRGMFTDATGALVEKTLTTTYTYEDDDALTPPANDGLLRKVVDPLGKATRFSYNAKGDVLTVSDPLGRVTSHGYWSFEDFEHGRAPYKAIDKLASTTDAAGKVTRYSYDERGHMDKETRTVTVVDEAGATRTETLVSDHDYDAAGHLVKMTDAAGHATTYENDAHGNRRFERTTRTVNGAPVAVVTEHEYDANDRLLRTWDAEHPRAAGHGPASETVYDEIGKAVLTRDALGRETGMTYNARGELETTSFADGTNESVLYDADGRREYSTDRRGKTTRMIYDAVGRLASTVFLGSAGDAAVTLGTTTYDAAGRVHTSTDANGHTTTNVYDDAGRRVGVIDALGHASSYAYDDAGNLRFFTDAEGRTTEHVYDVLNRRVATLLPAADLDVNGDGVIGAGEQNVVTSMSTGYDELGRRVSETDANGRTKRFVYDRLGRLTHVVDTAGQVTSYSYDELGNQLTQTDAKQHTTRYGYDHLGRRVSRTLPLGQSESVVFNAAGNVTTRTDFNGTISGYSYDAMNRLLTRTSNHANAAASNVTFTYTASGQRETMSDASGVTTYGYDARGRLASKATPQGTLTYGYDAAGNVASMTSSNANGVAVTYRYDELNRLDEVEDNGTEITRYGYDNVGNLAHVTTPNGVTHAYGYNALNRLTSLDVSKGATALASYAYTQLRSGHRTSAAESFAGGTGITSVNRTARFGYDNLYRLTNETIAASAGPAGSVSYTHDAVGNRLTRSSGVAGLGSQAFGYDANDRLTSDTYDANGNTVSGRVGVSPAGLGVPPEPSDQTMATTYDAENRVRTATRSSTSVQIIYDGDGNKVRETVNGQVFTYLVDTQNPTGYAQVVEELQNGTVIRTYTYGHDLLVQDQRNALGAWSATWFGYDGHGSVRLLTNGVGTVTDRYDYDAFGILLQSEGTTYNRYRYCGEQFDDALGLYYLRARYMNAASGRFWNMDSYEGQGRDPASLHKYLYCGHDPVNCIDPSGYRTLGEVLTSTAINVTIGAIAGAAIAAGDAALRGANFTEIIQAAQGGATIGAATGALATIRALRPVLALFGAKKGIDGSLEAFDDGNEALGIYRAGLSILAIYSGTPGRVRPPAVPTPPNVQTPLQIGADLAAAEGVVVYRNVPAQHPAIAAARTGSVEPYGATVSADPFARAIGHDGGRTNGSGFTSWTADLSWALDRQSRLGGVVIKIVAPKNSLWMNERTGGVEAQVLVPGAVRGEVIK